MSESQTPVYVCPQCGAMLTMARGGAVSLMIATTRAAPAQTLSSTGTVYVTRRAAEEYATAEGLQIEEARKELTRLLLDAVRAPGETRTGAEPWRVRSRTAGVDVGAHVAREGRLAVVVHVNVRRY